MTHRVAVVSGGMDSVTLAHLLRTETPEASIHVVSFYYGQRHSKEEYYAARVARTISAQYSRADIRDVTDLLATSGSVLVDHSKEIPKGHYAAESMRATVVPNRNAILISIAAGIAVAEDAIDVSVGVHAGDHFIYPDCRPEFINQMDLALQFGNKGFGHPEFHLYAPFLNMTKTDIALIGRELGVDYAETWSCYKGDQLHCGECGTCVERHEALEEALGVDPTLYSNTPLVVRETVDVPHSEIL